MQIQERFEQRFSKSDGCWNWHGPPASNGYGQFSFDKQKWLPHRLSYTLYKEAIPHKLLVCHTCDNRLCVNPEHLYLGTHVDNNNDTVNRGRNKPQQGSLQWLAKLTEAQAADIRSDPRKYRLIASDYGVSQPTISRIKNHRTWKHV